MSNQAIGRGLKMLDALVAIGAPEHWRSYCDLAGEVEMAFGRATKTAEGAGRSRLMRGGERFSGLIDCYEREALCLRRPSADLLLTEIAAMEEVLITQFREELRSGKHEVTGYRGDGHRRRIEPDDLSDATIDLTAIIGNALVMPDGTRISGIEIMIGKVSENAPTLCPRSPRRSRRQTRPPEVRNRVFSWLDALLEEHGPKYFKSRSDHGLGESWRSDNPGNGSVDHVRKLISTWRKEHSIPPRTEN